MQLKDKPIVLVLDSDISPGPGVLNTLTQLSQYQAVGVTTKPNHRAARSPRYKTVHLPEFEYAADAQTFIQAFQAEYANAVILPTTSRSVRWPIRFRDLLAKNWKLPLLPTLEAFEQTSDKASFAEFASNHQIAVPSTRNLSEIMGNGEADMEFPVLAKPIRNFAGEGIERFNSVEALSEWTAQQTEPENYIVQNWLAGQELSGGLYCENGTVHTAVFYTWITRRSKYGAFHSLRFVRDENALKLAEQIVQASNWNGVANIDFRYSDDKRQSKSKLYALEVNPRPWGNFFGAAFMGVNFALLMCQSALGETISRQQYRTGNYYSPHDSMVALRKKATLKSLKGQPIEQFRWRDSALKALWSDPLTPLGYFLRNQEGNNLQKFRKFVQHSKPNSNSTQINNQ